MSRTLVALSRRTSSVLEAGSPRNWRLTPAEEDRMSRLRRTQDRNDFLAAHLLVRVCAARLLGVDAGAIEIVQRCTTCGGPHGRPEIDGHPGVGASLAHSRGVVAAAAGPGPVGIDIEAFPPAVPLAATELSAVLTAAEVRAVESAAAPQRALLLAWARKEACLKAGLVDLDGLAGFDLSALALEPPVGDLAPRSLSHGGWAVHDWEDGGAGAIGAVVAPAEVELALAGD